MNKRSDRLHRVHQLVEAEEKQHCRAMGDAQRMLDEQQRQLEELEAYRREYGEQQPSGNNLSSTRWADYQSFLRRLDDAVQAQVQLVSNGRQNRDAHQQRWMQKRQRVESLQRVVDRYRDSEQQHRERLVQKAQDDLPPCADPFRQS